MSTARSPGSRENVHHCVEYFRLGIVIQNTDQDPEDEVNEFLGSSIDARSVDR